MYKIESVASDIKLLEQKIADRFYASDGIVKTSGIILKKPFKLQVTAVGKYAEKNVYELWMERCLMLLPQKIINPHFY